MSPARRGPKDAAIAGSRPSYADLLARTDAPAGSSWGLWGADDRLGCLNLITPEAAQRGARSACSGRTFSLNLDMALPDPPLFARKPFQHEVVWLRSGVGHDEILSDWNPQSSSQWDGFRHMKSSTHGFYNGLPDEEHGIDYWSLHGIATRGVLADVQLWRTRTGRPLDHAASDIIEPGDLDACLESEGVTLEPGDILLVRTGWVTWYKSLDSDQRDRLAVRAVASGLRSGRVTAAWLWDHGLAAVAADNPGLEASPTYELLSPPDALRLERDPAARDELILHMCLLPLLGMPIGELWDLDRLADDCARDNRYTFLLTSAPINLRHGVGSPANALAVK